LNGFKKMKPVSRKPYRWFQAKIISKDGLVGKMKDIFKHKGKQNVNVWKVVSVVFIFLFILVIIGGVYFRIPPHFRGQLNIPTQDQIDSAKATIAKELQKDGDDIQNYQVAVSENIRGLGRMTPPRNILQVSLQKNSTMHLFLIDVDSGEILMHSRTEFYGWPGPVSGTSGPPVPDRMMGGFMR